MMRAARERLARAFANTPFAASGIATPMPLHWRISLIIGILLTATLGLDTLVMMNNARGAVQDEIEASLATAESNLSLTLELLQGRQAGEIESVLRRWKSTYSAGRHLCIAIEHPGRPLLNPCATRADLSHVPAWFLKGAEDVRPPVIKRIQTTAGPVSIHLFSDAGDELLEAWVDVRDMMVAMAVLAFAVNVCAFWVISRSLQPLRNLVDAMDRIGRGGASSALPEGGAYETRVLSEGLHNLERRLSQSREAVRRLHLRNLDLQEEERRMVARELHDEIGHHVAAIELETIRIARMSPNEEAERQARLSQLRGSVAAIHRLSRNLLHRLRPPSIEALGLCAALDGMFDRWREDYPELQLISAVQPALDRLPVQLAVHLYRMVQESLSNVARHAGARIVRVDLGVLGGGIRVRVLDDGRGFDPEQVRSGFGLVGLQERAEALSGRLEIRSKSGAGTLIEISIPMDVNAAS